MATQQPVILPIEVEEFTCAGNGLLYEEYPRESPAELRSLLLPQGDKNGISDRDRKGWWLAQNKFYGLAQAKATPIKVLRSKLENALRTPDGMRVPERILNLQAEGNRKYRDLSLLVLQETQAAKKGANPISALMPAGSKPKTAAVPKPKAAASSSKGEEPVAGTNNARATVDVNPPSPRAQGSMHREPAPTQASDPRLKPSSGPIDPLAHRGNSTFASPRDTSDERGRASMSRPNDSTGGYRRYSPRRGNSPPRHFDRNFEDRPITRPPRVDSIRPPPRRRSPHTPPRTYPALPRSRSPPRRTSDTYNRQNERTGDSYRPSRFRSRSPPRRGVEREYARDQLSPRGLRNGDRYRPTQPMPSRQPARNGSDSYLPRRVSPDSGRQPPMSMEWEEPTMSAGGNARRAPPRVVSDPETSHRSSSIKRDVPIPMQREPYQGLKRRAGEEPQTELAKRSPVSGPERAAKRRRIDETDAEMDVEMDVSLANPGNSGGALESIPPMSASLIASVPVTQPPNLEEYPSLPPLIPTGNQNKLLMRMVTSTRELTALTPSSSDDPDDALRHQNMRGAPTSSLTTRDATDSTNPPAIARVSSKDPLHSNQSQNNPQPTHTGSTLPSSNTPTENLETTPSRRASGSEPTPPQHASTSEANQSVVALLDRIDLNQTSVSQFGDQVVEVPDLRGSRQPRPRVLSGNDQDASQPLHARIGPRADEAAPQRPRQGFKGGLGGSLAARLG